jgi:hypothetical protein
MLAICTSNNAFEVLSEFITLNRLLSAHFDLQTTGLAIAHLFLYSINLALLYLELLYVMSISLTDIISATIVFKECCSTITSDNLWAIACQFPIDSCLLFVHRYG